ncbi:CD4-2 molecule, tandem duplicate 2 [Scomber japonicus]|uniref:CD4-2 molecule, tandem duplicate 2 n=1 Tax=Scomber japonicus TaxID=13676 RepID=UPI002306379B|nr:CD4-2 molecule, tandem duplicate 2 [Scomber japonicus]
MPPNSDPTFKMKTIVWFMLVLGPLTAAGDVVVVKQGEKAIINCGGNTDPRMDPVNVDWKRGQESLIRYFKRGTPLKGQSDTAKRSSLRQANLVISDVNKEDAGKLTCLADRQTYPHTLLVVSASVSPSGELKRGSKATLKCQVYDPNPVPKVQWMKPGVDKPTESHTVVLNPVDLSDAGTWVCEFPWDGQTKNVSLKIKVKAPEPTTVSPSKTSEGNKKTCNNCDSTSNDSGLLVLLGLSLWVWVGIGVGSLVTISLMVVVIVLYKRIKRRKERHRRLKNSRQPLTPRQYCECDHPTAAAKPQQGRRREKTLLME